MTDPTSRVLSLLGLLESRSVWTGAELAERLGVTPRTLRRDVERLRDLGYVVEADPGPGGGYALGRGQVVPPLLLDEEQAVAVTLALTRAAHATTGPEAEAALRALSTIDAIIPSALRHRLAALRESSTVIVSGERPDTGLLLTCADAIRRRVRLHFDYRDRHGTGTTRSVEPHRLVARARSWLLVAFDLDRDDWRTFRIDRMRQATARTWRFTPRPGLEQVVAGLDEPVPPSAWRHRVVLHIHAPHEVVAEEIPQAVGRLRPLPDGGTEFVSGADDPEDAACWLARMRHDFTLLGDDAVREAVEKLSRRLGRATR
ncbi:YafY family transcriptional regulator [Arachnia propionica]|uniref:YafY family transcriptional regulator n=1 Tax=Arachnia propionica TaxID=1750 RepID=A0A3P1T5W1_9ACTN|nr:YafY family protein [Arachnia propionica]RRD04740.1 YafY family transcriptional regulator [Arachnia propionica]